MPIPLRLCLLLAPAALAACAPTPAGPPGSSDPADSASLPAAATCAEAPGSAAILGGFAWPSIEEALAAAPEGSVVTACAGSWTGSFIVERSLTLAAEEGAEVVLEGDGAATVQITGGTVVLRGLIITGGVGTLRLNGEDEEGSEARRGGGIDAIDAEALTLEDCVVQGNTADLGAGVYGPYGGDLTLIGSRFEDNAAIDAGGGVLAFGGSLVVSDAIFSSNTAQGGWGGGLYANSIEMLTVSGSAFEGNVATAATDEAGELTRGGGGGVALLDVSTSVFEDTTVVANSAYAGGGLYLLGVDAAPQVDLTTCTISENEAGYGGGVFMWDARLEGGRIEGNTAETSGGGVYVGGETSALGNVSVTANRAEYGGGGYVAADGPIQVEASRFEGNAADEGGGGLYTNGDGTVSLFDTGITGNAAPYGGGVRAGAPMVLDTASVVSQNEALESYGGGVYVYAIPFVGGTISENTAWIGGGVTLHGEAAALTGTTVSSNTATAAGGGVAVAGPGITLSGCIVSENLVPAGDGGGLWLYRGSADTRVIDSSIVDNTAEDDGGGLAFELDLDDTSASVTFEGTLIDGNDGRFGGAILVQGGEATVTRSTVTNNMARGGGGAFLGYSGVLVSTSTDWGTDTEDNAPDDVGMGSESYTDFGAASDFECTAVVCE